MDSEICNVRILFPVTSDEDFIKVKKKITEALSEKQDAIVEYSVRSRNTTRSNNAVGPAKSN